MSFLSYGIVDLSDVVHTREISRQAVLTRDRQQLLHTRWTFDVDSLWNPGYVAYERTAAGLPRRRGNLALTVAGAPTAPVTDVALRQYLMQPRRKLTYKVGGRTLLECPINGPGPANYQCDVTGGPVVEFCNVRQVHGRKSFLVSMRIVADVIDTHVPTHQPTPLLSHRWERFVSIGFQHDAETVTRGEAIFRKDELLRRGTVPDQYRAQLFHPIGENQQRVDVKVRAIEDGYTLQYEVTDKEFFMAPDAFWGAVKVDCHRRHWVEVPSALHAAPQVAAAGAAGAGGFRRGGVPWAAGGAVKNLFEMVGNIFPRVFYQVSAEAWGNRRSDIRRLTQLVVGILAAKMPFNRGDVGRGREGFVSGTAYFSLGREESGKHVDGTYINNHLWMQGMEPPEIEGAGLFPVDAGPAGARWFKIIEASYPDLQGVGPGGAPRLGSSVNPLHLPNDFRTQGTLLERVFAQGLWEFGSVPTAPPGPDARNLGSETP